MKTLAVVVPTIRKEKFEEFKLAWKDQFEKYNVDLVVVSDMGKRPEVQHEGKVYSSKTIMGKYDDVIFGKSDICRNLGFAYVWKYLPNVEYILTLDDDVLPNGDTIGDHLKALQGKYHTGFVNTINNIAVRGMPYTNKSEAVISHGVWIGSPDLDAPHQLVLGEKHEYTWYKGVVPRGSLFPMCIMNVMFKRSVLPYMYQYPMFDGVDRFGDMWGGIIAKRTCDLLGVAVLTGFSSVIHNRASDPFKNVIKEAKGLGLHEQFIDGNETHEYFVKSNEIINRWFNYL